MISIKYIRRSVIFRLLVAYSFALLILFSVIFTLYFEHSKEMIYRNSAKELEEDTYEFAGAYYTKGLEYFRTQFDVEVRSHDTNNVCLSVLDPNGGILMTTDLSEWDILAAHSELLLKAANQDRIVISTLWMPRISSDVLVSHIRLAPGKVFRMAVVPRNMHTHLNILKKSLIATAIIVLTAGIVVCWITLHRTISRITGVTKTALSISTTSLDKRVPLSSFDDEIDGLGRAFNGMLDRIEMLVTGLGEIIDNVAHDLKSPVTHIRVVAESLSTTDEADAAVRETAERIVEESDGLLGMINTTLEIKAIDTGVSPLNLTECDVADIVRQACSLFVMVAHEKGIILKMDNNGPAVINGDLHRLQRVFANLIDNALKYTNTGGKVGIHIQSDKASVRVAISDTGIGIPPEALGRVFDRFFRADKSRGVPGLGLGLNLAETIIRSHGGTITVESSVGEGSKFTVILPRNGRQSKSN